MTDNANDLPPCLIYIDKEGRLWHQGAEMIHAGINSLMLEHITLEDGRYIIEFRGQRCYVEVEDTALVVQRVSLDREGGSSLKILLSDGRTEELNPDLLWIGRDNVIYTKVRDGKLPARFLRQAYYQLAEFIEEVDGGYALKLGGKLHHIVQGRPQ